MKNEIQQQQTIGSYVVANSLSAGSGSKQSLKSNEDIEPVYSVNYEKQVKTQKDDSQVIIQVEEQQAEKDKLMSEAQNPQADDTLSMIEHSVKNQDYEEYSNPMNQTKSNSSVTDKEEEQNQNYS